MHRANDILKNDTQDLRIWQWGYADLADEADI
jgi:hypothetical protein